MNTRKTKPVLKIYNNCSDDNPTNKLPKLGGSTPPDPPFGCSDYGTARGAYGPPVNVKHSHI